MHVPPTQPHISCQRDLQAGSPYYSPMPTYRAGMSPLDERRAPFARRIACSPHRTAQFMLYSRGMVSTTSLFINLLLTFVEQSVILKG
jgi:hypothetical protein